MSLNNLVLILKERLPRQNQTQRFCKVKAQFLTTPLTRMLRQEPERQVN